MKTNPDKYCLIPIVENIQGKLHYIKSYFNYNGCYIYKIDDEIQIIRQTNFNNKKKRINYHDH